MKKKASQSEEPQLGHPDGTKPEDRQDSPEQSLVEKPKAIPEEFDGKSLYMLGDGLFKYVCKNVKKIDKVFFSCPASKNFGLRKGDIVMVVDEDEVKNVVV